MLLKFPYPFNTPLYVAYDNYINILIYYLLTNINLLYCTNFLLNLLDSLFLIYFIVYVMYYC